MTTQISAIASTKTVAVPAWLLPLLLLSAIAIADIDGLILPNSYRTPLSDLVFEQQPSWRAKPTDDNPWRNGKTEPESDGRFKVELLPHYDYSEKKDPARNRFMNEDELARPKTNILKYNF